MTAVRTLVVRCPDWPVIAAGVSLREPAVVLHGNTVLACSPVARAEGVRKHMRRRDAQARCPELLVIEHDPGREARAYEPLVGALSEITPRIEVGEPGTCAFPTRGPARYFGGDDQLATRAHALVAAELGERGTVHVGVADGPFTARLAARNPTRVVPEGKSPEFLAPLPLSTLEQPELVHVLSRLGLRTLRDLAALPARDVLARFGSDGARAHRLASGLDERPPATRPPPRELSVEAEIDPPAERVDVAAFVGRSLADELHTKLAARGHVCTLLLIAAETEHGETLERLWRLDHFSAGVVADRVRWQLDGWLNGTADVSRPTAGVTSLRLEPAELATVAGRQLGFWGGGGGADERVVRALARVEGLLGPEAVTVPEWSGGRDPDEQVKLVPAGVVDITADRPSAHKAWRTEPWPGSLPTPSPATVLRKNLSADLTIKIVDDSGDVLRVSARGDMSGTPAWLEVGDRPAARIVAWSGPWPVHERWWDDARRRRHARFQVATDDGVARLVALEDGRWRLVAVYD